MSPDASERLLRWIDWLGVSATEAQLVEMQSRWGKGADPPKEPLSPEWPEHPEKVGVPS